MERLQLPLSRAAVLEMSGQLATDLLSCQLIELTGQPSKQHAERSIAYAIQLRGAPAEFSIAVRCKSADARTLAARMTGKRLETLSDEVVRDALGEWLNIFAGQIKSLAGLDHALGLPHTHATENEERDASQGVTVCFEEIGVEMWVGFINAQLLPHEINGG